MDLDQRSSCHNCLAADATSQIKAGCGHETHICQECRNEESEHIRHQPCLKCRGGWCQEMEPAPTFHDDEDWGEVEWDDYRLDHDTPAYPLSCDVSDCYDDRADQYYDEV